MAPAKYRRSGGRRRILGNDEERLASVAHAFVQLGRDLAEPEDGQATPGSRPRRLGCGCPCERARVERVDDLVVEGEELPHQRATANSAGSSAPALPRRHSSNECAFSGRSSPR